MWKPGKKTLFVLMILMAIFGGLTSYWIDWTVFETNKGVLREIQLPIIFLVLSFYFMIPYLKKIKEEKKNNEA
ncbi:hypothetical protein A9Q86_11590 [Flavobacteriales bacterium 33_180_T64]|nr:hypothetical protein A9Q86_11590 [Flavobacteriales bacterium 33_180_T64]